MLDLDVDAQLLVEETGGGTRNLRTDDLGADATGAAKESSVQVLLAELGQKLEPDDLAALATAAKQDALLARLPAALEADGSLPVTDTYTGGEALASQAGANAVLEFTFAAPRDLIWVRAQGGDAFADPFGGVPANGSGIYCEDGIPQPITCRKATVKVWAPAGSTVYVWGYSG